MKRTLLILAVLLLAPATAHAGDVAMVARDVPLGERSLQSAAPPIRFNMLGLHWRGEGVVRFRTRSPEGLWRAWRVADADGGPDLGSPERRRGGWQDGNLEWTGDSDRIQFRAGSGVVRLRAHYLWSRPTRPASSPLLRSLSIAGSPTIVPRSSWKADEKITRGKTLYAPALKLAIVHHTAGTNRYTQAQAGAIVRGIELYHVKANGWNDIGYNFLVDRYGTVYEGRAGGIDKNVVGAHSLGFNSGTVGVALIGNGASATPTQAQQDALVQLLAWRLDVAHVDPLSSVVYTSAGNSKFKAGKPVTVRAITGHRDTGPSECPGARAYALLPALTKSVARTGLPKLYSTAASGALGGPIRFQGRLSSALPWTVSIANQKGKVIATGSGRSTTVDWTWSSVGAGKGPFVWTMAAGSRVLAASGSLGKLVTPDVPKPTAPPLPAPAPPPSRSPTPLPVVTTTPPDLLSGLTVTPGTLTPTIDGSGTTAAVGFTLRAPAFVTATVASATGGPSLLTLLTAGVSAGQSAFQWGLGTLRDGRYRLTVAAAPTGGSAVMQTADFVVDRTLGGFAVSPLAFSPNGDGVADTVMLTFSLNQPVPAQVVILRAGVAVGTVWSAQVAPGQQVVSWDGTVNGVRLPDGEYVAVVTATGSLGAVSLLQPIAIDTAPPALTLLDGPSLRLQVSEPGSLTAVVNGQTINVSDARGAFSVPWSGGAVTSFTAQARDAAGNLGAAVSWP